MGARVGEIAHELVLRTLRGCPRGSVKVRRELACRLAMSAGRGPYACQPCPSTLAIPPWLPPPTQAEGTEGDTNVTIEVDTPTSKGKVTTGGTIRGSGGATITSQGTSEANPTAAGSQGELSWGRCLGACALSSLGARLMHCCPRPCFLTSPAIPACGPLIKPPYPHSPTGTAITAAAFPRLPGHAGSTTGQFQGLGSFLSGTTAQATSPKGTITVTSNSRSSSDRGGLAAWGRRRAGAQKQAQSALLSLLRLMLPRLMPPSPMPGPTAGGGGSTFAKALSNPSGLSKCTEPNDPACR